MTELRSRKRIHTETVLYAAGRQGATEGLGLEHAGLEADARGRIAVGEDFRTCVPHIFAVGDVAGPPGLAAIAYEQGRIATLHAFDQPATLLPNPVPTGVYAIPEIGMVGSTEEQLTEQAVPYVVGLARWSELARGLMTGDEDGILKLLVAPGDGTLLGVHVLGTTAADLVHIGQALMGRPGALDSCWPPYSTIRPSPSPTRSRRSTPRTASGSGAEPLLDAGDGDHVHRCRAGAGVAGGGVLLRLVPATRGLERVELEDHEPLGLPLPLEHAHLAAAGEVATAVALDGLGRELAVARVLLGVRDDRVDHYVSGHRSTFCRVRGM